MQAFIINVDYSNYGYYLKDELVDAYSQILDNIWGETSINEDISDTNDMIDWLV